MSYKQKKLQNMIISNLIFLHLWKPPLVVTGPPFVMFSWHLKGLCHWKKRCHKLSCKQKKLQNKIILNLISLHLWKPPLVATGPLFVMFSWHLHLLYKTFLYIGIKTDFVTPQQWRGWSCSMEPSNVAVYP